MRDIIEDGGIENDYLSWIISRISIPDIDQYTLLINTLHYIPFTWNLELDGNRAFDGINLRNRFAYEYGYSDELIAEVFGNRPCSVLEMMAALAIRCEDNIMCDDDYGDRTPLWFWTMINNLGLNVMTNDRYSDDYVFEKVRTMLERRYSPNGAGGLFYVRNPREDLRYVDIWYQLMWFLSENY